MIIRQSAIGRFLPVATCSNRPKLCENVLQRLRPPGSQQKSLSHKTQVRSLIGLWQILPSNADVKTVHAFPHSLDPLRTSHRPRGQRITLNYSWADALDDAALSPNRNLSSRVNGTQ